MVTRAGATARLMKRPLHETKVKRMQVTKTNIMKESGILETPGNHQVPFVKLGGNHMEIIGDMRYV